MSPSRKRRSKKRRGRGRKSREFKPRLKPLTHDFEERLVSAFNAHDKVLWIYYFPFLYCYGRTSRCSMLYTQTGDSHVLFLEREGSRGRQLDLFVPPIPLTKESVEFGRRVIGMRRRPRPGRILWVDEQDAAQLRQWGLDPVEREKEYLLNPKRLVPSDADLPRRLRRKLRQAEEQELACVPYEDEHREAAYNLVDRLAEETPPEMPLLDYDYTVECLGNVRKLTEHGMIALAALHNGEFAGFAFGGGMTDRVANFFIIKTDPDVPGLAEWLRMEFLKRVSDYELVNDASDLGLEGLAQHKRQFMPIRMLPAFTVRDLT